jgi:hypothetical protein
VTLMAEAAMTLAHRDRARFELRPSGGPLGADIVGFAFHDFTQADIDAARRAWLDPPHAPHRDRGRASAVMGVAAAIS